MADKSLIFMQRSLSNAFLNPHALGVMISAGSENWSSAFMLYGEQIATAANALSDEGGAPTTSPI